MCQVPGELGKVLNSLGSQPCGAGALWPLHRTPYPDVLGDISVGSPWDGLRASVWGRIYADAMPSYVGQKKKNE